METPPAVALRASAIFFLHVGREVAGGDHPHLRLA